MKSCKSILIFIIFLTLTFFCCSKSILTSGTKREIRSSYDAAAFSELYVEALKQKLIGNGGDALKYLEQCIKINPESDAAYYQMAQILISNGDIKNGKKYAAKALEISKENIWYLSMTAELYYREKNIDSAIILYEKAVKYFPEKENLKLTLGNLYSENKKYDKANSIFESFDNKYGVNEKSTL
jgi:tetratricopeptide (TPR) repeat protein